MQLLLGVSFVLLIALPAFCWPTTDDVDHQNAQRQNLDGELPSPSYLDSMEDREKIDAYREGWF